MGKATEAAKSTSEARLPAIDCLRDFTDRLSHGKGFCCPGSISGRMFVVSHRNRPGGRLKRGAARRTESESRAGVEEGHPHFDETVGAGLRPVTPPGHR